MRVPARWPRRSTRALPWPSISTAQRHCRHPGDTVTGPMESLTLNSDGTYSYTVTSHGGGADVPMTETLDQNGFVTSTTLNLGVADPPIETWSAAVTGVEAAPIGLGALTVTFTGGDTLNTLTISGAPAGAILSDGHGHTATSTGTSQQIDVSAWILSSLTVTPANDTNFTLTATATGNDAGGNVSTATTAIEAVTVDPTAPTETWAPTATGVEGAPIVLGALGVTLTHATGEINSLNTVMISGAPAGAVLSDGTNHVSRPARRSTCPLGTWPR